MCNQFSLSPVQFPGPAKENNNTTNYGPRLTTKLTPNAIQIRQENRKSVCIGRSEIEKVDDA